MNTQTEPEDRITYDPKEFMTITGLSKTAVYQGIDRGEIPSVRIGRRILIPKSAVDKMFDVVAA